MREFNLLCFNPDLLSANEPKLNTPILLNNPILHQQCPELLMTKVIIHAKQ